MSLAESCVKGGMKLTNMDDFKKIEKHLKKYKKYKISIQNLERTLDLMYPKITSVLEPREGSSGNFNPKSDTEEFAIKRIEKREKTEQSISQYKLIIDSIDAALKQLEPLEREFVEMRYIQNQNMKKVAVHLGYSLRMVYTINEEVKEELLITLHNLTQIEI